MIECAVLAMGIHMATYHPNNRNNLNGFNPGIYANCDDYTAGVYHNSYRSPSVYVAKRFGFVAVGAVTGYPRGPVLPMLVFSHEFNGFRFTYMPPIDKITGGVHFSYEWKLK